MMLDILITNQPNILASLQACRLHLETLEEALAAGDYAHLHDLLGQGAFAYEALTGARDSDER
jgi:prephenate dehydrogenase